MRQAGRNFIGTRNGESGARRRVRPVRVAGYTLIEVLITVLIIQMISGMVVVNISDVQRSEKLSRAGQQVVVALRYARMLAMSSGQQVGVEFDTSKNQVRVFEGGSATTVNNPLIKGGTYVIDFTTQPDVAGVTITNPLLAGDTTNPYWVVFETLGGTNNNGYVTLNYGGSSITVQIPLVGDATIQ